jgi:hypothetical protein
MSQPSRLRSAAAFLAKLVISVGILVWLFQHTDVSAVAARARTAHVGWVVAGLAIYAVMVVLSSWRWQLLLGAQGFHAPLNRLNASWMVALFFNNFLPSNIGGDVIRIADSVAITRSRTVAAAVVLVDRAIGLAALLVIAASGLDHLDQGIDVPGRDYVWIAAVGMVLAGVPTMLRPALLIRLLEPLGKLRPELFGRRIDRFSETLHRIAEAPARLWGAVSGALAVQFLIVIFYLCIAWAIDARCRPAGFVVPVSLVLQMAPVSVNRFGVREAIFAWFFSRLGLPTDAAIALSLLSTATVMLFSLGGGVIWVVRRNHRYPPPTQTSAELEALGDYS